MMEAYDYTSESTILSDSRVRKSMFAKLMWEEKDTLTHLLGFEYSDMIYDGDIFSTWKMTSQRYFYFCNYIGFRPVHSVLCAVCGDDLSSLWARMAAA